MRNLLISCVILIAAGSAVPAIAQVRGAVPAIAPVPDAARFESRRIVVERRGNQNGPSVVMLPGMASTAAVWEKVLPALERRYDLHLVSVRGFGEFEAGDNGTGLVSGPAADEVRRYILEQGLQRPALIGHSMGGQMALRIAADGKDEIGRVMVVDSSPFFPSLIDRGMSVGDVEPFARLAFQVVSLLGDEALRSRAPNMGLDLSGAAGNVFDGLGWQGGDRRVLAQSLYEVLTTDLRYRLPDITAPVTVVYGWSSDSQNPRAQVDGAFRYSFMNLRAPAAFVRMTGAEHMVMIDTPRQFERAVIEFLGQP